MRIAQVAPLMESVPPKLYGGTERTVSYLTDALVDQGHAVTLFASGDSRTKAHLIPVCHEALRLNPSIKDTIPYSMILIDKVFRMADRFDIIHFHMDQFHFPLFRAIANQTVTTIHGRQDSFDLQQLYPAFPEMSLVSISKSQIKDIPHANVIGTVAHGLPINLHHPAPNPQGKYLAFLGRIAEEKGPDRAIAIAKAVNMPLKIAAKVDKVDRDYYRTVVKPLLDPPFIEYIGEINESQKTKFLGEASALLFPITWPEPFGLAMIEAMACGTPVLAFDHGSVREVIDQGVTGYIVKNVKSAIKQLPKVIALDRTKIRLRFEERFTSARMASDYIKIYQKLMMIQKCETKVSAQQTIQAMFDAAPVKRAELGTSEDQLTRVREIGYAYLRTKANQNKSGNTP
jgi:glycosyltransferase involved in cell wall biosynthesis